MTRTTGDLESYHARNPINVDKKYTCLRGICYSIPISILLWLLILFLVDCLV